MPKRKEEFVGGRPKAAGGDRDRLLGELETKLLSIARSSAGATLPSKAVKEIESSIDGYYERWKK